MLDWFGRRTRATVAALAWLSFLQVGDYTAAVTPGLAWEGWWLLGRPSAGTPGRGARAGVVHLAGGAATLRRGGEPVRSVRDFPVVL